MIRRSLSPPRDMSGIMVAGDGARDADIMFVGKRPGLQEANYRRPFVGDSGQEFNRYLREFGIKRRDVWVTNLVRNYTGDDIIQPWELDRDAPLLLAEIEALQPRLIVPLGADATRFFLPWATDMEMVNGLALEPPDWLQVEAVIPIIHPAAGLHDSDTIAWVWDGFRRLASYLECPRLHMADQYPDPIYTVVTTPPSGPYLACDTEGWRGRPYSIQLAAQPGIGEMLKHPVKAPMPSANFIFHGALHDLEQLSEMGWHVPEGRYTDNMIKAYNLCLLPRGLKPLSFRLAGMRMDDFSEMLQPVSDLIAMEYLHGIAAVDWGAAPEYVTIERDKHTGMFTPKIKQPQGLNRRITGILNDVANDKRGKDGTPPDPRKRWAAVAEEHPSYPAVLDTVGPMPLAELSDVRPESAVIHYGCRDADATLRDAPVLDAMIDAMGLRRICEIDHAALPMLDYMVNGDGLLVNLPKTDALAARMDYECGDIQAKIKRLTGYDINPNSPDQVADLLYNKIGIRVLKRSKKTQKPSTNNKALMTAKTAISDATRVEYQTIGLIQDYRERSKIKNSFCVAIKRRTDKRTSRIRPDLRYTSVSQGRLSCVDPNLLALPTRTDLGRLVRDLFEAPPGYRVATWDYNQLEMRFMASESQEPALVDAYWRHEDIHTNTASRMFGLPPEKLDKNYHRNPAKRAGFGIITGITGAGLVDQMMTAGAVHEDGAPWTVDECDELIEKWFSIYPGVATYCDKCGAECRRNNFVRESVGGRIRYLPGIHSEIERIRAESKRQSHSFKISGGAAAIMKIGMYNVWQWVKAWQAGGLDIQPKLQVHDELLFYIPEGEFAEVDGHIQAAMAAADQVHLLVPLEVAGCEADTWGNLKK